MRGRWWPVGLLIAGVVLVGAVYGLIWYAIPERGAARLWYVYGPLLLGPYALAAAGTRRTAHRAVLALSLAVCLAGAAIVGAALLDARPVFEGGRPPDIPASAFLAVILLAGQYAAGLICTFIGATRRHVEPSGA
jgi:thiol:disulfide interchange protein